MWPLDFPLLEKNFNERISYNTSRVWSMHDNFWPIYFKYFIPRFLPLFDCRCRTWWERERKKRALQIPSKLLKKVMSWAPHFLSRVGIKQHVVVSEVILNKKYMYLEQYNEIKLLHIWTCVVEHVKSLHACLQLFTGFHDNKSFVLPFSPIKVSPSSSYFFHGEEKESWTICNSTGRFSYVFAFFCVRSVSH